LAEFNRLSQCSKNGKPKAFKIFKLKENDIGRKEEKKKERKTWLKKEIERWTYLIISQLSTFSIDNSEFQVHCTFLFFQRKKILL
jgi:hypothetical protein